MSKEITIGAQIRAARLDADMSMAELGNLAGISAQAVEKWESGKSDPTYQNLKSVSKILGLDVDGTGRGSDQMMLRFPQGQRDAIKAIAKQHRRSMNAEVLAILERGMAAPAGPNVATIGARIKQLREAKGFGMQDLADAVGVSAWQTVQQWENGSTAPARSRLIVVAEALGVSAEYLMFGDASTAACAAPAAEATLRDEFAGRAMQAALNGHIAHHGHENHWPSDSLAKYAYELADAMMLERAK